MKEVFEEFSTLLKKRLSEIYTNEPSVRFTFLVALLKEANIAPHEVILEYPHPKIPRAKVDHTSPQHKREKG